MKYEVEKTTPSDAGCPISITSLAPLTLNLGLLYKKTTNDNDAKYQCFRDKKLIVEHELNDKFKELHTKFEADVFPSDTTLANSVKITLFPECQVGEPPGTYAAHNLLRASDDCLRG